MNPINFLIEENYAQTPDAASKILSAASDEFYQYIMEASQAQYDRLRQRLTAETNPQRKAQLQAQLDQMVTDQRQRVLNPKKPKSKQIIRNAVKSSVKQSLKSKPAKAIGRFLKYTFLGGLVP
jgi:uncharacterized protein (DUF2267 family)